jgi:hypothetical protein
LRTGPFFVAKSTAYFAGAESALEEVDELVLEDFLWCFFFFGVLVELVDFELSEEAEEVAGVEVAGAVDWANAGPAIRAMATTGTRCFNIDLISREIRCLRCLARVGAQAPQLESARIITENPAPMRS